MDNNINNIENDDIKGDINKLKIKEEDDIKSNINEIDNLVSLNDSNNYDLSNEEENNESEEGSDNIDHYDITEYNNNLLELYENLQKQTLIILLNQKLEKGKLIIWKMKNMILRNLKVQKKEEKYIPKKIINILL